MKKHRPAEQRCSNEQTVCPWRKRKRDLQPENLEIQKRRMNDKNNEKFLQTIIKKRNSSSILKKTTNFVVHD